MKLYTKECKNCGLVFTTKFKRKIFCSDKCRTKNNHNNWYKNHPIEERRLKYIKTPIEKICQYCNKPFITNRKNKIFCSEHCAKCDYSRRASSKEIKNDKWNNNRLLGITRYCIKDYELIENYELAKQDNFDRNKWHLHHRLENYWTIDTLKRKNLYYNVNPESLIWLPANEHLGDLGMKKENSKWHKAILEKGQKI